MIFAVWVSLSWSPMLRLLAAIFGSAAMVVSLSRSAMTCMSKTYLSLSATWRSVTVGSTERVTECAGGAICVRREPSELVSPG